MARQNEIRYVNMYMVGSAACRLEPVRQQKKPVKLPNAPKQRKLVIRVDPLAAVGLVVAIVMIIALTAGVVRLSSAQQETAALVSYIETLENKNAQLEKTYRESYDLEQIARYAEAMGLVPVSQVDRIQATLQQTPAPEHSSPWEEFCMFLTGLFA